MELSEKFWNKRSKIYGNTIEGVLPKTLPKSVNLFLDQWMYSKVREGIKYENKKEKRVIKLLDLGCGYGRISEKILKDFSNITIKGVDISQIYVDLFNSNLAPRAKAYKSNLTSLPFKDHEFDIVIVVTSLIYLKSNQDLKKGIEELFRVLKRDGVFIIIESNPYGHLFFSLGEYLTKKSFNRKIGDNPVAHISPKKMETLIRNAGGFCIKKEGITIWTWMIPIIYLSSIINEKLTKGILSLTEFIDKRLSWLLTPSLYISYIGHKNK